MRRIFNYLLACLVVLFVTACTRLPEYARPKMLPMDGDSGPVTTVPYRTLSRDDFQAVSPHKSMTHHNGQVNAHLTAQIRLADESRLTITPGEMSGSRLFFGRVEHLSFEAAMIPEQSWWNPNIPQNRADYVLEHEQIHFALTEIAARQLSRESQKWASQLLVIRAKPEDVLEELGRQINERITTAKEKNLLRHEMFDEDTSLVFNPRRQKWWLATVARELQQQPR